MSKVQYYITCTVPAPIIPEFEKEYRSSTYDDWWAAHEDYWKICIAMQVLHVRPCTVSLMYYDPESGECDVNSEYILTAPPK